MAKKDDLPAMPFYFGDWFKAMDVQSLPRDTKCVWFEMLGRMWESNERGFLTINGKPMSDFAKAKILGFGDNVKEYLTHEKILEESGIFSRREDGAMYSRFMLKMVDISNKRKQSGSKGGSKTQEFAKAKHQANTEDEYENETEDVNVLKEQKEDTEQIISGTLDYWNEFATKNGLSTVIKLTKKRTAGIFARNKEKEWDIEKIYKEINQSDFLRGSSGWKVDFDFIFCSENNYLKILEGKYRNGNNTNGIKKTDATARATFKHSEQQIKDLESFGETLRKRYSERS